MKRIVQSIFLLYMIFNFTACQFENASPLLYKDNPSGTSYSYSDDIVELDYTIDTVTLSKNYQSVNPNVEILKNGLDASILLSLGIVESSGVEIEKIERDNKDINIYVQNKDTDADGQIVVPQVLLHLNDFPIADIEELNFKIITQNYTPIKVNLDIGEAISKIESFLKISTSTFPDINLYKREDKLFLDVIFKNAVDLSQKENPIINLNVLIDISDGKIVNSKKESISSLIDEGIVLEYVPNKYIIYVKENPIKDDSKSLWVYDIRKDTKKKIHTTKNKIKTLKSNQDGDRLLLIESSGDYNRLYTMKIENSNVNHVNLNKKISPFRAIWKDNDNLILIDKSDKHANIYNLNLPSNNLDYIAPIDKDIKEIQYLKGNFLYVLEDEKLDSIYITQDFKNNLLVDTGFNPVFIDNESIGYLKHDTLRKKDLLWIYNIKDKSVNSDCDLDAYSLIKWGHSLGVIEKNQVNSDNPLYIYDKYKKEPKFITSMMNDKVFLNSDKNILYVNYYIDTKNNKRNIISFIDLKH